MINYASFGITQATNHFRYVTAGMALVETLDAYEGAVVAELRGEWQERLDGLIVAYEAAGYDALAETARELSAVGPEDTEARNVLLGTLMGLSVPEYRETIGRLADIGDMLTDPTQLQALAWERQVAATETLGTVIELRPDTSPAMRELLAIKAGNLLERDDIRHLMLNRTADGAPIPGKYYPKRQTNAEPTAFFGMVFSASKSVSVHAGFAWEEERARIYAAHDKAVDTVLRAIEGDIGWVRRGKDRSQRERGETTWIRFRHETSRRGDPQIHTHVVVLNVVRSLESEAIGSLDTRRAQGRINSLHRVSYHEELARNLREVGINATFRTQAGVPEAVIEGVGVEVQKALSQRRQDGLAQAAEQVGGDLSVLSPYARKRVVNGAVKHVRPEKGAHTGDRATWEKRLEAQAKTEWRQAARTLGWEVGGAANYLAARTKAEIKRPKQRTQARGLGHEDSGGGGGGPRHRFVREQERER